MESIELNIGSLPKSVKLLLQILNNHGTARIVGGYVRDIIYKKIHGYFPQPDYYYNPVSEEISHLQQANHEYSGDIGSRISAYYSADIDLATDIDPYTIKKILLQAGINVIETGIKYGTVTAIVPHSIAPTAESKHNVYEITTLREDVICDGRYAVVEFGKNWKNDAARRDFTINALSLDCDGRVYDYFNGIEDIKNNHIRFIGNPAKRIQEDYLRILRYFRFVAYLDSQIIPEQMEAIIALQHNIKSLSRERIWGEMRKILAFQTGSKILAAMQQANIFPILYLQDNKILQDNKTKQINNLRFISNNPISNLSALLHVLNYSSKDTIQLCNDWKLSNNDKKDLIDIASIEMGYIFTKNQRVVLFKLGHKLYEKLLLYRYVLGDDIKLFYSMMKHTNDLLPINGNDIKKIGIKSEKIGIALDQAKEIWIKSDFTYNKTKLLHAIKRCALKNRPIA